jgi:hypothetical protein
MANSILSDTNTWNTIAIDDKIDTTYNISDIDSIYISTNTMSWSPTITTMSGINPGVRADNTLKVQGDAVIDGDLTVGGKSIMKSLEAIEERLAILNPNKELEERWDKLRELRNQYAELEKELIEKEKMWAMLKK